MKKKSNISKKIQSSEPWEKKYNRIEELKDTEEEWENSYDEKRKKKLEKPPQMKEMRMTQEK